MTFTQSLTDLYYSFNTSWSMTNDWVSYTAGVVFLQPQRASVSSKGLCTGLLLSSWDGPIACPLLDMVCIKMPKYYERYHSPLTNRPWHNHLVIYWLDWNFLKGWENTRYNIPFFLSKLLLVRQKLSGVNGSLQLITQHFNWFGNNKLASPLLPRDLNSLLLSSEIQIPKFIKMFNKLIQGGCPTTEAKKKLSKHRPTVHWS